MKSFLSFLTRAVGLFLQRAGQAEFGRKCHRGIRRWYTAVHCEKLGRLRSGEFWLFPQKSVSPQMWFATNRISSQYVHALTLKNEVLWFRRRDCWRRWHGCPLVSWCDAGQWRALFCEDDDAVVGQWPCPGRCEGSWRGLTVADTIAYRHGHANPPHDTLRYHVLPWHRNGACANHSQSACCP